MKKKVRLPYLILIIGMLSLGSCGPVIISPSPQAPPPPWFYPNRVEMVRYVYFPDYVIYYDLSNRNYLYLENNVWVRVPTLPPRFANVNFNRSRFVHINGYRGETIRNYHRENYPNSPRSSRTSRSNSSSRSRSRSNT